MPVTDPTSARILVYNVVVTWVGPKVNLPPNKVDVSLTFMDAPPGGYQFNEGMFLSMCDEITPVLAVASGRALKLPGPWRVKHEHDAINVFINEVALRLLAAPLTPAGVSAHNWALTK
jgi:hypothetical protein